MKPPRSKKERSTLDRLVDDRAGGMLVGTISVAVEKIAEEIAKEALADEEFRRTLQTLVRERSRALLKELLS
jgi:hypothetical protein